MPKGNFLEKKTPSGIFCDTTNSLVKESRKPGTMIRAIFSAHKYRLSATNEWTLPPSPIHTVLYSRKSRRTTEWSILHSPERGGGRIVGFCVWLHGAVGGNWGGKKEGKIEANVRSNYGITEEDYPPREKRSTGTPFHSSRKNWANNNLLDQTGKSHLIRHWYLPHYCPVGREEWTTFSPLKP